MVTNVGGSAVFFSRRPKDDEGIGLVNGAPTSHARPTWTPTKPPRAYRLGCFSGPAGTGYLARGPAQHRTSRTRYMRLRKPWSFFNPRIWSQSSHAGYLFCEGQRDPSEIAHPTSTCVPEVFNTHCNNVVYKFSTVGLLARTEYSGLYLNL